MSRLVFKSYKNGCAGLKLIKQSLTDLGVKALEIKTHNSKYTRKQSDTIVDWGKNTGGKDVQLSTLTEGGVPTIRIIRREDFAGIFENGGRVVCRTILNGHGGAGIVVASSLDEIVNAPLYTLYQKKTREFRVHVVIIDDLETKFYVAEKKKMAKDRRPESYNPYIRNHDNGWVFTKQVDNIPEDLFDVASRSVICLGLSIGAVDIGYHPSIGSFVFEVNTAPGCDSTTAEFYATSFAQMV